MQMKYHVDIRETLIKGVEVEADSIEEAKQKVKEMYDREKIVLDWEDFTGNTDVRVYDENCKPLEDWDNNYIRQSIDPMFSEQSEKE